MAAPVAQELAKSKGVKSIPVRKGDTVRVMRGDRKGFEGKISKVDLKNYRLYIEGLTREKVDGTTIFIPLHPSKVMIKNLNLDDKWRKETVERKNQTVTKEKETVKKGQEPPAKSKAKKPSEVEETEDKMKKPTEKLQAAKSVKKKASATKPRETTTAKSEKKPIRKTKKSEVSVKKKGIKRKPTEEGGT